MPIEVNLAKLSPTMESGQLVKWNVKVGDKVKEGDILAEVQTDKAVMPMESFDDGTVAVLDVKEGDDIQLGQRVLVLAKKNEDVAEVAAKYQGSAPAPPPQAKPAEAVAGINGHESTGSSASTATAEMEPGGRVRSTPLARRIAREHNIDLAQVPGSGPHGRIVREDVEAFLKSGGTSARRPAPSSAPAAAPPPAPPTPAYVPPTFTGAPRESRRIPHSQMRKTIAKRMLEAKQAAPEIHVTVDVRMDQVMAARERLNKQLERENIKLSVGDFVTKAVAMALRRHPALNASFEADSIVEHGEINLGIAVALDGGLIVPVLQNADLLGLRDIRLGTLALADAARQNKLTPKQMMGGTFTISNLGMYGVKHFDAILNLPEVGILAVGGTEQRPIVEDGQLTVGWVMTITLTADHRAVDGATAAEFMRTLKLFLEEPTAMLI